MGTTYTITADDIEFTSRHLRDVYDVWAVQIVDSEGYSDGVEYFDSDSERDAYEVENDLTWSHTDFESRDALRHKEGSSTFYDEPCTVDVHIDVCVSR